MEKTVKETLPTTTTPEPTPVSAPRNATLNSQEQASIGKSLVIKGEVIGAESLYIEGRVEGSINLSGTANRVTVGKSGVVIADLSAREIVIMGRVTGNLVASDRLDIRSDGWLAGDVTTHRISIEDGAYFKGSVEIQKAEQGTLTGTDGKAVRR
ncbi:MAG: polymer-forming cytoskeletal protein [Acidobacteriales bacterium]|nr:polymer-forming cytoskeletal protein [Terriglobales bacterium]